MSDDLIDVPASPRGQGFGRLVGRDAEHRIGVGSARGIAALSRPTRGAWWRGPGSLRDPLPDPYLAVAEMLILVLAPLAVLLLSVIHACAPRDARLFSSRRWDGCSPPLP
jgi:hypothetical protein